MPWWVWVVGGFILFFGLLSFIFREEIKQFFRMMDEETTSDFLDGS